VECGTAWCTGWRRPIGCLKSQVIFRKRGTNSRALLLKMTYKDKASYGSSPPCSSCSESGCRSLLRVNRSLLRVDRSLLFVYDVASVCVNDVCL